MARSKGAHRTAKAMQLPDLPRAACRGRSQDLFFAPDMEVGEGMTYRAEPARRICRYCPERLPCLDFALSYPSVIGVWGGTTTNERAVMRAERAV